jgi:hypothetical protein
MDFFTHAHEQRMKSEAPLAARYAMRSANASHAGRVHQARAHPGAWQAAVQNTASRRTELSAISK